MPSDRLQLRSLYLPKFASSFGGITLVTLLPTYIDLLNPSGALIGLFVLVAFNGLLAAGQRPRAGEQAVSADEGAGSDIASSFGLRNLVWLPGSIVAPMVGGHLLTQVGMARVFYLGGPRCPGR